MTTTINTNINSINAQRSLASTSNSLATSMARLSSGLRINSAADDAAGLSISERMDAQTRGMNVAIRNANDAIGMAQTADGALGAITNNLQRMRELAVQASNGTNTSSDITSLNNEYKMLSDENIRVVAATKFNGQNVIASTTFTFQVGANAVAAEDQIAVTGSKFSGTATDLGTTTSTAFAQITKLDADINTVNSARSQWGAVENRFNTVISNLQVGSENSAAAHGRIVDANYAQETANLSRAQVLQQAGTAMVAQANQGPQGVLTLLR
ncbi:flagellin [Rhodoferax sp.]|uniref:flagellin N-terminal helical domain-containing protein n=1 Tax=Rhodoferax sp. TaxID=50421 RepID=UPI00284019CE|nr:flagellin [Rhodoferax sp.]MDR3371396.1 flagellin [Rhodoferax sp.]